MSQSSLQRVCITGIGAITPFAVGWNDIFHQVAQSAPTYGAWNQDIDPPFEHAKLGLVKSFPKERYFNERQLRLMDKAMGLCSVAAAFAMEDSGLLVDDVVSGHDEVATILASSRGEAPSLYRFGSPLFRPSVGSVNPAHFPMIARNVACGQIAIRFGLRGWSTMIAAGDASGSHALARASEMIALGRANTVLVGAYEVLSQISLHQLKARWRKNGTEALVARAEGNDHVPVEGACFFVVESEQHAVERGRRPYATIEHATHGYRFDRASNGWQSALNRHLRKYPSTDMSQGALHVSGASMLDHEPTSLQQNEQALSAVISQSCNSDREIRSRSAFGDGGALTAMYGVATAAQLLRNNHAENDAPGTPEYAPAKAAIVSSITERGAYSLFSMRAN